MKTIYSKKTDSVILVGKLAPDKMKLFVDVEPVQAGSLTKEGLMQLIHEFSKTADLHEGVIDDILKTLHRGEKVEERRIAKGIPPETGADGKVLLLVKKFTATGNVKVDEKGFADYRELHLFDNIQVGQVVARVYGPKPGKDGCDALGALVKATPGKPAKVTLDKSLVLAPVPGEDYQNVVAQVEGYLEEDSGKLAIRPELVIKGDLDLHTGNINFIGSVKIMGSVMPGMQVQAKKGIEVMGDVRSATFQSTEGDIKIRGYYFGGPNAKVLGGKSFVAGLVQEVNVEVQGEIRIEKEALDSLLRTQTGLFMSKGRFIGGRAFVVCGAEALEWGNEAGKHTEISLCSDVEVRSDFAKVLRLLGDHERAIELLKVHLGPFAVNPARLQRLNAAHREKMENLLRKLKEVELGRAKLLAQKKEMLEQARSNHVPRVNVLGVLHPGVVIRAGKAAREYKDELKGPKSIDFKLEGETFEEGELKGVECNFDGEQQAKKEEDGKRK